jgi:hypothetical protein
MLQHGMPPLKGIHQKGAYFSRRSQSAPRGPHFQQNDFADEALCRAGATESRSDIRATAARIPRIDLGIFHDPAPIQRRQQARAAQSISEKVRQAC